MPSPPLQLFLSRASRPVATSLRPATLRHFPCRSFWQGSRTPTRGPHPSTPPILSLPHPIPSTLRRTADVNHLFQPPLPSSVSPLESGSGLLVAATSLAIALSLAYYQLRAPLWSEGTDPASSNPSTEADAMASAETPPGRPGNLTHEEEEKLRQLWSLVLRVFGSDEANPSELSTTESNAPGEPATSSQQEKVKKKRSLFGRKNNKASNSDTSPPSISSVVEPSTLIDSDLDDKYGQMRQFHDILANLSPDTIRETLWSMVKHDNPDALLLRFLRARKWDVEKALVMLISTMNWRAAEMHVDDEIMRDGEGGAALAEKGEDGPAKVLGHEFMDQMRMGKAFLHGTDKVGRPICFVRVRLHRQGDHSEEALEKNTVFVIETCRMLLKPPIDTAVSSTWMCCPRYRTSRFPDPTTIADT